MPVCVEQTTGEPHDLVRAHYDQFGFYFAESETARAVMAAKSQLGRLLAAADPACGPIVDVGCGEGRVYFLLADAQRSRYLGIDLSRGNLARAHRRVTVQRWLQGDACTLPLADGSGGLVICQGVLHHTVDPRATLAELARVTRPGGLIQVSVYSRRTLYYHAFRALAPLCFRLSRHRLGRVCLATLVFPLVYVGLFEPLHLAYGVHLPIRGAWCFFLDQFAHPRVWFFRRRELLQWAREEGLEVAQFNRELGGWMLSFVFHRTEACAS